jgi:alcohol dehydrogenase
VEAVTDGRILGHEAVGTVESVGSGVKNVKVGDRVLASCITVRGAYRYCRDGQCLGGGSWNLAHKIDGTQAERGRGTVNRVSASEAETRPGDLAGREAST